MTVPEVSRLTGLSKEAAKRARLREFSETIQADFSAQEWRRFEEALAAQELRGFAGGYFYTVVSMESNKGRLTSLLSTLYRRLWGRIITIGLGDSLNDEPMLRAVDRPFLVQQPNGDWAALQMPNVERVAGIGPAGWRRVVFDVLGHLTEA